MEDLNVPVNPFDDDTDRIGPTDAELVEAGQDSIRTYADKIARENGFSDAQVVLDKFKQALPQEERDRVNAKFEGPDALKTFADLVDRAKSADAAQESEEIEKSGGYGDRQSAVEGARLAAEARCNGTPDLAIERKLNRTPDSFFDGSQSGRQWAV